MHALLVCEYVCVRKRENEKPIEQSWQLAFDLIFSNNAPTSNGLSNGSGTATKHLFACETDSCGTCFHISHFSSHCDSGSGFMN